MKDDRKIYDVSMLLGPEMITYPGNPVIEFEEEKSASSTHTKVVLSTHTGTHLDAPKHVFPEGGGVGVYPLSTFMGRCRVLDLTGISGESVTVKDLQRFNLKPGERLVFKTKNSLLGYEKFRDDFIYIDGDTADWLAKICPLLVGVDYLSVKKRGGPDNRPHTALLQKNIAILEGLDLHEVSEGEYELLFLPLRLDDRDGSPGRAVLREIVPCAH